ncbi:MAG: Stf0 family sulfotransferase [Alphaproteobacteria bacterium]
MTAPPAILFDAFYDQAAHAGRVRPYVVCSSPRSGSTLLCHLLIRAGGLGVPAEYLTRSADLDPLLRRAGVTGTTDPPELERYLDWLFRYRSGPDGMFGIQLQFNQVEDRARAPALQKLLRHARFVYLVRRDPMAQAISFAMARGTRRFHEAADAPRSDEAPRFDLRQVREASKAIALEAFGWSAFFEANRIQPLTMAYEDMMADPGWTCRRIAEFLGAATPAEVALDDLPLRRQRSPAYDAWRDALLRHFRIGSRTGTADARGIDDGPAYRAGPGPRPDEEQP